MARKRNSNYKIMACFDTETTNDRNTKTAFAITYQLSVLKFHAFDCSMITNENVNSMIDISIDRDYKDIFNRFDELISYGKTFGIVPVVMVHNLSFEMWIISSYISRHDADGCSKSTVKPLTINIKENGENVLVFWDTLSFWGKPLSKLGDECKYPKLSGCWDYGKFRTPETPLTDMEYAYAREDVVVPWVYLGYYLRLNPEIDEHDLACKILTKTSVVRYKSMKRCGNIRVEGKTTSYMWTKQNQQEKPKSDYELEMTHSSTRGGFTYCAAAHASKIFKSDSKHNVIKFDANSMHICHALSHKVAFNYRKAPSRVIELYFDIVKEKTYKDIIENYDNPFDGMSFFGRFRFTNVRLKENTVFKKHEISTFAQSRFGKIDAGDYGIRLADNEGGLAFSQHLIDIGWGDYASEDAVFLFGKYYGSSECVLVLNELSAWEFCQQFDYDSMEVIGEGYKTGRTTYATDKSVLSFNEFYKAKTEFKKLKGMYEKHQNMDGIEKPKFVPDYLMGNMKEHRDDSATDVETFYLSVKSELNALYGIEATNEAKNDIILTKDGYAVGDYKGVDGLPKYPKAWYQYGSHIVGWSRIHQILFMLLLDDMVDAFICGDTDSHKIYTTYDAEEIEAALKPLHDACDAALEKCTKRARNIKEWYPMDGLGYYECEGYVDAFSASWNKSYIQMSHGTIDITMAGVPCNNIFQLGDGTLVNHSYNKTANYLYKEKGWSFDEVASMFLGYNVRITHDITGLNQRKLPKWATFDETYHQPCSIYIYPMMKCLGNTRNKDNLANSIKAKQNNPMLNVCDIIIDWPLDMDEPCITNLDDLSLF